MEKHQGCCKDEVKIVKLQDDQNTATVSYNIKVAESPALIPSGFISTFSISSYKLQKQDNHIPPELSDQEIYLQNRVFRI